MRIYHFSDGDRENDYMYATAFWRGTWFLEPGMPGICPECGRANEHRIFPLIIEWEPGSDTIGDFTWPSFDDEIVVTDRVREFIVQHFCCVTFELPEMYQHPKLKRPQRITKRTKPRVWLPYDGPTLWDMKASVECQLDHDASRIRLDFICSSCNRPQYVKPKFEERHLVIDRPTWHGEDIFNLPEYTGWTFCTERVKVAFEAEGFTNVRFVLDGEVPE